MAEFDYNKWLSEEVGVQLKPCTCGNKRVKIEYFQEQLFARCVGMSGCGKRSKALIFEGGGNSLPEPVLRDGEKIVAHLWNNGLFSSDCDEGGDTMNTNPECFSPEENNPQPLCVGKDMPECENCQLRADWEPDN